MSLFNKIKQLVHMGSKELAKTSEELSTRAEEIGKEGIEFAKEKISLVGEKATDITNMIRYKMDVGTKQGELNLKYQVLGEISFILCKSKKWEEYSDSFNKTINEIYDIRQHIDEKDTAYQELRKRYSNNYEIKKLSDDLSQGNTVIRQVVLSEKSNVADKLIKEIMLPKDALISVVKRGEEVIIPDGNTKLYSGDGVTVIGKQDDVEKISKRLSAG
jgi:K+/H+ antiporter YhaU regulatory subunit KhtT